MATIRDVAKDAGVSVGTVSNVINGGRVSEARKRRVEESIRKLGYQVNTLARGMRMQKTDYVVVILPNITNPFFSLLLEDLEHELAGIGKQPLLCLTEGDSQKEIKYLEMARGNKVDGMIGVTYSAVEEYVSDDINFVSIERHFESGIPCISCDNYAGGRMAADELVRRGAKNLLCLQVISSVETETRKRRTGFEKYCGERGIPYGCMEFSERQVPTIYSSFSSKSMIRDVLRAYMKNTPAHVPVDGIFAGTDHLAVVILEELRAMGLRVPEDIQIVGYDGLRFLNQGRQVVSSIYQDTGQIAKASVECLQKLLEGKEAVSVTNLPVSFVEGGTTLSTK